MHGRSSGEAKVIYTWRDPTDAVASCMRMFGYDFERALELIESSVRLYRDHQQRQTALIIAYPEIVDAPTEAIRRIASYLDLEVPSNVVGAVAAETSLARASQIAEELKDDANEPRLRRVGGLTYDSETLLHPGHIQDGSSGYGHHALTTEQVRQTEALLAQHHDELYEQAPEFRLLAQLLSRLGNRVVIDVGAERGGFAHEMLAAGATELHLIEPEPENARLLRERFDGNDRVTVHEFAIGDHDGHAELRRSTDSTGAPITFGHTLLDRPGSDEITWRDSVRVSLRSLASLVDAGKLPSKVAILKIDAEGSDLRVVMGMGSIECDVLMVEHWTDLPQSLGPCPWNAEEMVAALQQRGFSHYAFVMHHGEFSVVKWDDAAVPPGSMGNLVFLHHRVVDRLLLDILASASMLARHAADLGEARARAADGRLTVIDELKRECARLATAAKEQRAAIEELDSERDLQAEAAEQRLSTITKLERGRDAVAAAAEERLATIEELTRERDLQAAAARERLAAIEELTHERDAVAAAAEERLASIEELTRERDALAAAAAERLDALEQLASERDRVARAADERLDALEQLASERDRVAAAAEERAAALKRLQAEYDAVAAAAEELRLDRDVHADAARARLAAIEELERERDLQARTAAERLEALETLQQSTLRLQAPEEAVGAEGSEVSDYSRLVDATVRSVRIA